MAFWTRASAWLRRALPAGDLAALAATYDAWADSPSTSRIMLVEMQPRETLRNWRSAGGSAYRVPWSVHSHVDTYQDAVLRSAPTGYWRLGEPSGTRASDLSGHYYAGTCSGGVTLAQDGALAENDTAAAFDGVNDLLTHATLPASGSNFTVEVWIKPDSSQGDTLGTIFADAAAAVGLYYDKGTRTLNARYGATDHRSNTALSDGVWVHVALVVTAGAGAFYLNGVPDGTCASVPSLTPALTGAASGAASLRLKGTLDELAYYQHALDRSDLVDHYVRRTFYPRSLSVYRAFTSVEENGTTLTAKTSLADVQATAGSYWFDEPNQVLYVRTTGSVSPDTLSVVDALFTVTFSTEPIRFDDRPPADARIDGSQLPTVRFERAQPTVGITVYPSGTLSLANGDGFFDTVAATWTWKNAVVTFKIGGGALDYSDFRTVITLRIAQPPAASNSTALFQLGVQSNVLTRAFPLHTYSDWYGQAGASAAGVAGQYMPMFWGTVSDAPITYIAPSTAGRNRFLCYDPLVDVTNRFIVTAVRAYDKATGVATDVTNFATSLAPGEIDVDDTFWPDTYEFRADMYRASFAIGGTPILQTCGAIAKDILERCGVSSDDLDSDAFDQADLEAPATLGVYVAGGPSSDPSVLVVAQDIIDQIGRSVLGSVHQGTDGRWTMAIYQPTNDWQDVPQITESDLICSATIDDAFQADDDLIDTLVPTVVVTYAQQIGLQNTKETSATSTAAQALLGTSESVRIATYLINDDAAATLAGRLQRLSSIPTRRYLARIGPRAMASLPGDKFRVTRSRGIDETGALDHVFEIEVIEKNLATMLCDVVIGNFHGLGDVIRTSCPNGTHEWDAATDDERRAYMYALDAATERAEIGDPSTYHFSEIW